MMKPDIDTEKYRGHDIHNNIKKNSVSSVTFVAKIKFMTGRNAIRRRNGVRGQCVLKKISYYTFPPPNCTSLPLNYTFPPSK
jgi:hypothetical protein